jgi:hypothetical protein
MNDAAKYTLDDLLAAERELKRLRTAFDGYSGNNPDKYESDLKAARRDLDFVTDALKRQGTIPWTEEENLAHVLDAKFPKARSKQVVEHEGERYQLRFSPIEWSRSRKTVARWDRAWVHLRQPNE